MTNSDYIRKHFLDKIGVCEKINIDFNELRKTEWCDLFEDMMRHRLIMGSLRYGRIKDNDGKYDRVAFIERRTELYKKTKNTEYLVDIANGCLLEFVYNKSNFTAVDDGEHAIPIC